MNNEQLGKTPLFDALLSRAAENTLRCHMPGHAGQSVLPGWEAPFAVDFTELSGTGNLYADEQDGPIRAAERLYADCYRAEDCLFLTGGATQGIFAMLCAFARPGDAVALDRNCHFSVHNALALLDLRPVWVQAPRIEPFGVTAGLPPAALAAALDEHPEAVCALVTSPTYYGVLSDLPALAAVCAARGLPLLADAAHGAHLPFLEENPPALRGHLLLQKEEGIPSRLADTNNCQSSIVNCQLFSSPVAQGAAAAVLSAHKTLPALGQSAFLLTGPGVSAPLLRRRAALFGSSSPSYVLMASLDAARAYMESEGREVIKNIARAAEEIRRSSPMFLGYNGSKHPGASATPPEGNSQFSILNSQFFVDPLRLCLYTGAGFAAAARLETGYGIVCEMADPRSAVLLLSAPHTPEELGRLRAALTGLVRGLPVPPPLTWQAPPALPAARVSPRQALFAPRISLPWREALGCIAAEPVGPYPPGAPLVARGEEIDGAVLATLERAGFTGEIEVISNSE